MPGQGIENRSLKELRRETSGTLGTELVTLSFWVLGRLAESGVCEVSLPHWAVGWHSTARSGSLEVTTFVSEMPSSYWQTANHLSIASPAEVVFACNACPSYWPCQTVLHIGWLTTHCSRKNTGRRWTSPGVRGSDKTMHHLEQDLVSAQTPVGSQRQCVSYCGRGEALVSHLLSNFVTLPKLLWSGPLITQMEIIVNRAPFCWTSERQRQLL